MTDKLPPNLLALFAPRPPLRWVPPCDHPQEERRTTAVGGVADFLPHLAAYKDADGFVPTESWLQARDRKKLEQKAAIDNLKDEVPKSCGLPHAFHRHSVLKLTSSAAVKPQEDPNIRGDAFKTLMVSRLSYDATEEDLEREFGRIGAIERVCLALMTHITLVSTADIFIRSGLFATPMLRRRATKRRSPIAATPLSYLSVKRT